MKKLLLLVLCFVVSFSFLAQGTWTQKASLPAQIELKNAVCFTIGTKGYVCTSTAFWEWDQSTNIWTQKACYPDNMNGIRGMAGCSIGNKGYVGTGDGSHLFLYRDWWEWDQASDTWSQKADFGTNARTGAVGFSIGNKAYLTTGIDLSSDIPSTWEYDPNLDKWTQEATCPGGVRSGANAMVIGTKAYVGLGSDSTFKKDFWEWDQTTNTWNQKADFPLGGRAETIGFSIGNKCYIGLGYNQNGSFTDLWEWDQSTNTWTQMSSFPASPRESPVSFSIGNKGYVGLGGASYDLWEFDPTGTTQVSDKSNIRVISIYPSPATHVVTINCEASFSSGTDIKISNSFGEQVHDEKLTAGTQMANLNVTNWRRGVYFVEVTQQNTRTVRKIVLID